MRGIIAWLPPKCIASSLCVHPPYSLIYSHYTLQFFSVHFGATSLGPQGQHLQSQTTDVLFCKCWCLQVSIYKSQAAALAANAAKGVKLVVVANPGVCVRVSVCVCVCEDCINKGACAKTCLNSTHMANCCLNHRRHVPAPL